MPNDVVIIGDGLTAKTLALTLMKLGKNPILIHLPKKNSQLPLALTLSLASKNVLTNLDLNIEPLCGPITSMVISTSKKNATPWHIKPPTQQPIMGYVIDQSALYELVSQATQNLHHIETKRITFSKTTSFNIQIDDRTINASELYITQSIISPHITKPEQIIDHHQYGHVAFIKHQHPHHTMAYQCFSTHGPIATLPLNKPNESHLIASLNHHAPFNINTIQDLIKTLGDIELQHPIASIPLTTSLRTHYQYEGAILIGDINHRIHPLAGQGFNLTLLDIAALHQQLTHYKHLSFSQHAIAIERQRKPHNVFMAHLCHQLLKKYTNHANIMTFGHDILNQCTWINHQIINEASGLQHNYLLNHSVT